MLDHIHHNANKYLCIEEKIIIIIITKPKQKQRRMWVNFLVCECFCNVNIINL